MKKVISVSILILFLLAIVFLSSYNFFQHKDNINIISVYKIVNNKEVNITDQINFNDLYYVLPLIQAQRLRFIYSPIPIKEILYDIRVQYDKGLCHIIVKKDGAGHISTGHYGSHSINPTEAWTNLLEILENS